jgi:hypothetical protein
MDYYKISWVLMVEKHKMQRIFATFGVSKKMVVYKPKFEVMFCPIYNYAITSLHYSFLSSFQKDNF